MPERGARRYDSGLSKRARTVVGVTGEESGNLLLNQVVFAKCAPAAPGSFFK